MILEDSANPLASPCALWFPSETSQEPRVALGHASILRATLWLSRARGHVGTNWSGNAGSGEQHSFGARSLLWV